MDKIFTLILGLVIIGCTDNIKSALSFGGERIKELSFSPSFHGDDITDEATSFAVGGTKMSVCDAYKTQLAEPKPKKSVCNVKCEVSQSVKCILPELDIPECNDYAIYVYKRILTNFDVLKNDLTCEIPTAKEYKNKAKLTAQARSGDTKASKFCGEYRKSTETSDFEFPCYVKCDTHFVGISLDGSKLDWELTCESYQHACTVGSSNMPMNVGNVCEAFRRYVMSKVKLGENEYHHCSVYNHGPKYNYFNRTLFN